MALERIMAFIHDQKETITASAGTANATLLIQGGILNQVIISPTTNTTTYDVEITNQRGVINYSLNDVSGDLLDSDIGIAMSQNATLTISNASVDEDFVYYVSLIEKL